MSDGIVQIVAPIGRDAQLLAAFLEKENVRTAVAPHLIESMTPASRDASGPLLIAEEALTSARIDRLRGLLETQPFWSDLPILVLTAGGRETAESSQRQRSRQPLGQLTLLERPLRPASLLSAVESALRARQRQYQVRDTTVQRDSASDALRESEELNRRVLQSTKDCIQLLDLQGNVISMNPEGQSRFGDQHAGGVQGRSWFDFWKGSGHELARHACALARENRQGRFEGCYETLAGALTWWDTSVTPVHDKDGVIHHLLAISRETTDRKLAEQALVQSEKLAAVGRLASSIAHEINNPLEAVTNLIFLAKNHAMKEDVRTYLDMADQELRRVSVIANQTLRFHKQSTSPRAVTAAELFRTVLSIYEGRLRNAGIQVETEFRAEQPVRCFEGDVRQVLNNLVGNAIDAMSAGGRLLIRSHAQTEHASGRYGIVLTVADTGVGMSREVLEKIFEAFFTTKGIGGTGLGLWVSTEVVARHDGRLRVRSSDRPGASWTVFRFFLPYAAAAGSMGGAQVH